MYRTFVCFELMDIVCVTYPTLQYSNHLDKRGLTHLLVHYNMDLDTLLSLALQDPVEPPFWEVCRRTAQIQFRGKPPILRA